MSPKAKSASKHDGRAEARYLFDPTAVRSANEVPEDSARLIWMFLSLIRRRYVDFASFYKEFRRGDKTFKRDIAKLRELGTKYRFTLTAQRRGKVGLAPIGELHGSRDKAAAVAAETLQAVADALGEIVANDVLGYIDTTAARLDPFLRLAMPRLVAQTKIADTYHELRSAWSKRARTRFRYPASDGALEERTVEPHLVTYYDGRYYLVAFDRRPRTNGWRQFALDRIAAPISLAGTFEYRPIPQHYRGHDAVGLFKSGESIEITIELSPRIAEAVGGRLWQATQRFTGRPDGWAVIAFDVFDIGEAVRWAFAFGAQARIVAPPEAVSLARDLAAAILAAHESVPDASPHRSATSTPQSA